MIYASLEHFRDVTSRNVLALQEAREKGRKVVGQFCIYSPLEIALAAGAVPVSLCGTKQDSIPVAEEVLPRCLCPLIKSSFGFALQDSCPYLAASDIVVADMWMEYPEKPVTIYTDNVSPNAEENKANMLAGSKAVSPSLCNKMIRREFWLATHVFSPENLSYCEDRYVTTCLYFQASKIAKADGAFYHYTHSNVNSITHKVTSKHFENMVTLWGLIDGFLVKEGCAGRYRSLVEQSKVVMKMGLMFEASYGLKRNYAPLFYDFELKYAHGRRLGEKWMLRCLHYKLYPLAQCVQFLVRLKNGKL